MAYIHVFNRANAAILVHQGRRIPRRPQLFFGFHKFLSHLHFLPLFLTCLDFTWVYIPSIWIIFLFFPMLSLLFHDILGVLQHLLLPKIKEVRRVCVEFECLFPIVPVRGEIVERWRSITGVVCFQDRYGERVSVKKLLVLNGRASEGLSGVDSL